MKTDFNEIKKCYQTHGQIPTHYTEWLIEQIEAINTPEIDDFVKAVVIESKHQRVRWGSDHDAGKKDSDWFWLVGYLASKALNPKSKEKQLHHLITTAAACLNWHSAKIGFNTKMRPGIETPHEESK